MINFLVKRLWYGALVLFGVVFIVFFLFNMLPINPARLTMGQRADVSSVEAVEKELGLNLPWHAKLKRYVGDLSPVWVHENSEKAIEKYRYTEIMAIGQESVLALKFPYLGRSFQTRRRVTEILAEKIPPTFILALSAILLATIVGVLLGIISAINQNNFIDNSAVFMSVVGISQPSYVSSIILLFIFTWWLYDYTGLNTGALFDLNDLGDPVTRWENLILPTIALGIRPIAIITMLTRSSMIEVLSQDYIRTAKAKGLSYYKILFGHALRNALNPVITSISGWFAALLAGAFFVELILDFKGLGYETVKALINFDIPVVMGAVLFIASVFVVINILVDLLYGFLDPRVSLKAG